MPLEPPQGLREAGIELWRRIMGGLPAAWHLDERELHGLERACRCADEILSLETQIDDDGALVKGSRGQPVLHPAIAECRQLRLAEQRLLSALELSPPVEKPPSRAQKAANTRWNRERRERARNRGVA